jgi:hypothetical protein
MDKVTKALVVELSGCGDDLRGGEGTGDAGQERPAKAVGGSMQGGLEVWGHGPCNTP